MVCRGYGVSVRGRVAVLGARMAGCKWASARGGVDAGSCGEELVSMVGVVRMAMVGRCWGVGPVRLWMPLLYNAVE